MKFENLVEMFAQTVDLHGDRPLFGTKSSGQWHWTSYRELGELVDDCRAGLAALGIQSGDRVCLISNNSVAWATIAYACYGLGAVLVPLYESQNSDEWKFIAEDCSARLILCARDEIYHTCISELGSTSKGKEAQVIGLDLAADHQHAYAALLKRGKQTPHPPIKPSRSDLACLIYTSGTTGRPKGVMLTHGNICSNIHALQKLLPLSKEDRSVSFLPWAHSFGHTCELHGMISLGASIALCEAADKVIDNVAEVSPTVLMSVPLFFNRLYDNVHRQVATKPKVIRALFERGLHLAAKKRQGMLGIVEAIMLDSADRLVFSAVRYHFGGKLNYAFSGGAALSTEVAEFIDSLGITVYQGYGLTETSPVVSANSPAARRTGSVGRPIFDVRVEIDHSKSGNPEHGEIIVYGPNVMAGYHERDEDNEAVFTEDGGLRTGDIGYLDGDGYLFITGRLKEQYKLDNGKYVAPAPLEGLLKHSDYIANVMIYGDNRPHNVGLVVPDLDALSHWASERNLRFKGTGEMLASERVKRHLLAEIGEHSKSFKSFETIKDIAIIEKDFTTDNGMLTPTMKVKRKAVIDRYGELLTAMYEH